MRDRRDQAEDRPAWLSFDQGRTWHDAKVMRRKPWRPDIFLVAALLLISVGAGLVRVGDVADGAHSAAGDASAALSQVKRFANELRDSAVGGCRRQNRVRQQQHVVQDIMRATLKADNDQSRSLTPSQFPDVQHFNRLVRDQIERNQAFRRQLSYKLPLASCDVIYPQADGQPARP